MQGMEEDLKKKMNLMEIKHQKEETIHNKDFNEKISQVEQKCFLLTLWTSGVRSEPSNINHMTTNLVVVSLSNFD